MNEFKVLGTNHTSFTVSDLERACAFFEAALGFEIVSKAPRDPDLIQRHVAHDLLGLGGGVRKKGATARATRPPMRAVWTSDMSGASAVLTFRLVI